MTLKDLLKKTEDKFEKEFGGSSFYQIALKILLSSQEEAYNLGEKNMRERIREWAEERINCSKDNILSAKIQSGDENKNKGQIKALSDLLQELNTNK